MDVCLVSESYEKYSCYLAAQVRNQTRIELFDINTSSPCRGYFIIDGQDKDTAINNAEQLFHETENE